MKRTTELNDRRHNNGFMLEKDLGDLTRTQLRAKYRLTENCHRNMLSREVQGGPNVSPELRDFVSFLRNMGPRPGKDFTIDRIDNRKGYSRDNCRWADKRQQTNNRRNTVFMTVDERTQSLAEWARETNQNPATLRSRKARSYSDREVVYGRATSEEKKGRLHGVFEEVVTVREDLETIREWYVRYMRRERYPEAKLVWLLLTLTQWIDELRAELTLARSRLYIFVRGVRDNPDDEQSLPEYQRFRRLRRTVKEIEDHLEDVYAYLRAFDRVERDAVLANRVSKRDSDLMVQIRTHGKILSGPSPTLDDFGF